MALTLLTVPQLAAAMRIGDGVAAVPEPQNAILARLGSAAEAYIGRLAPDADDDVKREAIIRLASYVYDMPESPGGDRWATAWRSSGAAGLCGPWIVRTARPVEVAAGA